MTKFLRKVARISIRCKITVQLLFFRLLLFFVRYLLVPRQIKQNFMDELVFSVDVLERAGLSNASNLLFSTARKIEEIRIEQLKKKQLGENL